MSVSLTTAIVRKYKTPEHTCFIETGTFEGGGVMVALASEYRNVSSIELDTKYYDICKTKFTNDGRVSLHLGDTAKVLSEVIDIWKTRRPLTFWLDAHYQYTVVGEEQVPLISELKAIKNSGLDDSLIFIDDRRLMGVNFWAEITLERVLQAILDINPAYKISYEDTVHAKSDIIVAHL